MITSLAALLDNLQLSSLDLLELETSLKLAEVLASFPLKITESLVKRIQVGKLDDPILLQFMPRLEELEISQDFVADPLQELQHTPVPGLIHKYPGRVLLLATDRCSVNCRFCFRRHTRGKVEDWEQVFNYLQCDPTIEEVIFSGGDPLMLTDEQLQSIFYTLTKIPHLRRLRIHSRMPITQPERITAKFLPVSLPLILVIHCNHPNEINHQVAQAIGLFRQQGIMVFNQSVLLKNINNCSKLLAELSRKLFAIGVIPYYLHLLDKVSGAEHFEVKAAQAKVIHQELQRELSGYLVPKLVVEQAGRKLLL